MSTPPGGRFPARIFCLSGEAAEILRRLGAGARVAGILETPPGQVALRRAAENPNRLELEIAEILGSRPDLVLAPHDAPVHLIESLDRSGVEVMTFPVQSLEGIFQMIGKLGEAIGLQEEGRELCRELREGLERTRESGEMLLRRPRVFVEEWPEPIVSAAGWVGELVEAAGGESVFPELHRRGDWNGRVVDPAEVLKRSPELIIAAWASGPSHGAGKVDFDRIRQRPGWDRMPAVRRGKLYEMESWMILSPGPTALTRGLARLHEIIQEASLG